MNRARLSAAAVLFLLVAAVYWRLILLPSSYVWFDHYDMCQLEVPRMQFVARSIHAGHFPLWDPHVWAGLPVLGAGQPGPAYPLNLLFLALPLSRDAIPVPTWNWWFIAIHLVAAFGMYLFCRDAELSRAASAVGGVAFACDGYFGGMPWLDVSNGGSLTPVILLFAMRVWRGRAPLRNAALLGLVLGVSWLSGHHEIPLISSYVVLIGSLIAFARRREVLEVSCAGAALVIAVAVSAVQTLPMYEFGHQAKRWVGAAEPIGWNGVVPYSVHQQYSLPWKGIAGLVFPTPTPEDHTTVFAGVTVLILAICGIAACWRRPEARMVTWIGLGGLIYALGGNTPIHRALYLFLPLIDKARTPVRGMVLTAFALSALAAFGAEAWQKRLASRRIALGATCAVAAAVLVLNVSGWLPRMYPQVQTHYMLKAAAALIVLAALSMWRGDRFVAPALVALVLVEATTVAAFRIAPLTPAGSVCATNLVDQEDFARRLHAVAGEGRITVDRNELMTTPGDLLGFDQMQSFVAGVPADLLRLELHTPRVQQLFGVTAEVRKTAGEIRIEPKPDALPRAWVVHRTVRANSDAELLRTMQRPDLDFAGNAIVQGAVPELGGCSDREKVAVTRPNSDTVILDTTLACRGLVILSDVFYPGWKVWVDGQPASIVEVDGALRGIVAGAGAHRIELRYQPVPVRIGMVVTLLGLFGAGVLLSCGRLKLLFGIGQSDAKSA